MLEQRFVVCHCALHRLAPMQQDNVAQFLFGLVKIRLASLQSGLDQVKQHHAPHFAVRVLGLGLRSCSTCGVWRLVFGLWGSTCAERIVA